MERLRRFDRHPGWVSAVLALAVMAPAIAAQIKLAGHHWYPGGDMAQAELHVRGIWRHLPLVGAAGRIESSTGLQGSHPGPSLWFALYPVYLLFGRTSRGLMVSVSAVHLAALWGMFWLARRRGGWALVVPVVLGSALIVRASGYDFVTEPWNPWLAVIPFGLYVMLLWCALEGDGWAWPAAAVVGSHCIQCHAGYALVVGALGAYAVVRALAARNGPNRRLRGWIGGAAAAGLLVWLPVLVDQMTRTPGNLSVLVQHFGSPNEPYLAKREVLRIVGNQLNLLGPWVRGREALAVQPVGLVACLALWGAAVRSAWRRDRSHLQIHLLLGVGVLAGCVSVLRVFGGYFEYTVRWWWVLTMLVTACSVWTLWSLRGGRTRSWPASRAAAIGLAGTVLVSGLGVGQFAARAKLPGPADSTIVGGLAGPVVSALRERPGSGRYLLRWFDPQYLGASAFGLLLELERQGVAVGVDPAYSAAALPQRVVAEDRAAGVLYLVIGERIDAVAAQAGVTRLAAFDPRTSEQADESDTVRARLASRFVQIGHPEFLDLLDRQYGLTSLLFSPQPLPEDIAALVVRFLDLGRPTAVFLAPPGLRIDALPELTPPS